jgi:hypothetical protein
VGGEVGTEEGLILALWVPFIWYAIATSRAVSLWLTLCGYEPGNLSYVEGSPIDRAVYSGLILLGIVILLRRRIEWLRDWGANRWLIVLFIYMLVSILGLSSRGGFQEMDKGTETPSWSWLCEEPEPVEAISKCEKVLYINLPCHHTYQYFPPLNRLGRKRS